MPERLIFPDAQAAADVVMFAARAARDPDALVRVRAAGGVLQTSSAVLAPGTTPGDETPTVLGMRIGRVDPELECDLVLDASALQLDPADPHSIALPEHARTAAWAGISPPRGGWEDAGEVASSALASAAAYGIQAVAEALPPEPGEEIVQRVRSEVWGERLEVLAGAPRGAAFAAHSLGFIAGGESVAVRRNGPWMRLSLARGHVLVRARLRVGLTPIRTPVRAPGR